MSKRLNERTLAAIKRDARKAWSMDSSVEAATQANEVVEDQQAVQAQEAVTTLNDSRAGWCLPSLSCCCSALFGLRRHHQQEPPCSSKSCAKSI